MRQLQDDDASRTKKRQRELIYHEEFAVCIRTFARENRQWPGEKIYVFFIYEGHSLTVKACRQFPSCPSRLISFRKFMFEVAMVTDY